MNYRACDAPAPLGSGLLLSAYFAHPLFPPASLPVYRRVADSGLNH